MPEFKIQRDSLSEHFQASHAKIQLFGGGFANGKTANAVIKTINIAKWYPGANILMARSTYPKLNDTLRKEFLKWCPASWIKSFPRSANSSNTCTLINGTTVNFRYIQQQGKGQESTTSNLLSATYDLIVVDQIEDPEIVHKDLLDLLGRLRGMTKYAVSPDHDDYDETMPLTGPRWVIITTNPTRNWVYKKVVKPVHDLQKQIINDDLMCVTDEDGNMLIDRDTKLPTSIIEIFEGSTYENQDNLEQDFIQTLESSYKGQMKERFLLGLWGAYEGLVYPEFSEDTHVISYDSMLQYYNQLQLTAKIIYLEGYDHGMAVPACYLTGFVDLFGNVFIIDGHYEKEQPPSYHIEEVKASRQQYNIPYEKEIWADPSIFKRQTGDKKLVGKSIASMFQDDGIYMRRGNNDIVNGIIKVTQYLTIQRHHQHPIFGFYGAPYIYFSDRLSFLIDEFESYRWAKDTSGEPLDKPVDRNDHGMDTIKYMLSECPKLATLIKPIRKVVVGLRRWAETDVEEKRTNSHRYGR